MKTILFNTKSYEREVFEKLNKDSSPPHELTFQEAQLNPSTTSLAHGFPCVCPFVNDVLSREVLQDLHTNGTQLIALRSAGYNHVNLAAAENLGMRVVRVPAYSPSAVAEHTVGLMLTLNRQIHRAHNRVREGNFSLEGLVGFDMRGKTVGLIGTGRIGETVASILKGFGCQVIAHDINQNPICLAEGVRYVSLETLFAESDIISLHCPLTPETHHLIGQDAILQMKPNVMLVNTSRGGIVDTTAVIQALKSGAIGRLGLDVYEEEGDLFFQDLSNRVLQDDRLARLMTFPNVLITGHQGFLTEEALSNIAETTLQNITEFELHSTCSNEVIAT